MSAFIHAQAGEQHLRSVLRLRDPNPATRVICQKLGILFRTHLSRPHDLGAADIGFLGLG